MRPFLCAGPPAGAALFAPLCRRPYRQALPRASAAFIAAMDWATHDYTRTYADTIYTPEPDYDSGVSLLDEAPAWTPPARRSGRDAPPMQPGCRRGGAPRREAFYGNVVSDRRNSRAIYDVAWDERPLRYNPNAGADWAELVPPPQLRPPGGGPAPSLAYPIITQSEAANGTKDLFAANSCQACHSRPSPCSGLTAELALQFVKIIILIVIVVLLAMTLSAAGRLAKCLEKTIKEAAAALGRNPSPGG
jgi:hypothetical protein